MRRTLGLLVLVLAAVPIGTRPARAATPRALTIDDRIKAQRAIEQVYWRHRIWPADNPTPKPSLEAVMPESAIRAKVEDYLKKSNALETWWRRPITGEQLQAELDRMARGSRDRRVLQELFDALGNDPALIVETLARPALVDRLARNWYANDERLNRSTPSFEAWWKERRTTLSTAVDVARRNFELPPLDLTGCVNDTWSPTFTEVPDARLGHTAVWTGTEMIVWGGKSTFDELNTGGRYNPATDTWTPTSTGTNVPATRDGHTAVWTGTEMILWGGHDFDRVTNTTRYLNSGGRYDPAGDTWTPTSTGTNVPQERSSHSAVWTGTEMIVWGGSQLGPSSIMNSGGRFNPSSDSWTPTSTAANVPSARGGCTVVWTGTEMIVWGGSDAAFVPTDTGGRYNPASDSWTATSTGANVPSPRSGHSAVWTGSELIVWGGHGSGGDVNTGGRYDPSTNGWAATSTGGQVPSARSGHSAVWTGSRMIVWGGAGGGSTGAAYHPSTNSWIATASTALTPRGGQTAVWTGTEMIVWGGSVSTDRNLNTGGRYNPTTDSWVATSMGSTVPSARTTHTAVWTGAEMIVWGGSTGIHPPVFQEFNTGGRYTPSTDTWLPTSSIGAPTPRDSHSAVWTGRQMVVWGGGYTDNPNNGSQLLNTGGRYDPLTDTWTATSTGQNVPSARAIHGAVWSGHEMLVWGGCCVVGTGGRYDPVTDTWTPMATVLGVPGASTRKAVWTGTELLTWAGSAGARYSPSADAWTALPTGPNFPAAGGDSVVWTGGEMIVWGARACSSCVNTGSRFNPNANGWTSMSAGPNAPGSGGSHSVVWSGTEMIVWGGTVGPSNYVTNSVSRYDPTADSWTAASAGAQAPTGRPSNTVVWTGAEMIVWGGEYPTATGGRYCACPSGQLVYRDSDGDGYGDPGVSRPSCDGTAQAGYVIDHSDCNDASASAHPGAAETCNAFDDDCNGLVDESVSGVDSDSDAIHDACDNCRFVSNVAQSDFDHDGQGDACDLNDGLILEWRDDKTSVSWQAEQGPTSWNVYIGDLAVLKATGVYTQVGGSNPLASKQCGVIATSAVDAAVPTPGKASFSLITGVTGGIEGSLGSSSSAPRPNTNPCP